MASASILTLAQEHILRAAYNDAEGAVHLDGRSLKSVAALHELGLVTFEVKRVPGRSDKGFSDIVVKITAAGRQRFSRKTVPPTP